MVFLSAFTRLFKKILDFRSRVTTREFLFELIWVAALNVALPYLAALASAAATQLFGFDDYLPFHFALVILSLATFLACIALVVRRLNSLRRNIALGVPLMLWFVFTVVHDIYDLIPVEMFDTDTFNTYDKLTSFAWPVSFAASVVTLFVVIGTPANETRKARGFAAALVAAQRADAVAAGRQTQSEPTFCQNCNRAEPRLGAKYCRNCGGRLSHQAVPTNATE
jgi:uncharacterized membrane protein YhaH (DUF805 family)